MIAALMTVLIMAPVAGCGAGEDPYSVDRLRIPDVLPSVDMDTFTLPVDAYRLSPAESMALLELRNRAVSQCLERFGTRVSFPEVQPQGFDHGNTRRYFLWSEKRAAVTGYKWPEITDQTRPAEPEISPSAAGLLTGETTGTVSGVTVPAGGCQGEANRKVVFDSDVQRSLVIGASAEAFARMWRDARVQEAVTRWSSCMSEAGFRYASPKTANDDPAFNGREAGEVEKKTALADVRCKNRTSLIALMAAVETVIQKQVIKDHQREFDVLQKKLEQQRKLAATVLG